MVADKKGQGRISTMGPAKLLPTLYGSLHFVSPIERESLLHVQVMILICSWQKV